MTINTVRPSETSGTLRSRTQGHSWVKFAHSANIVTGNSGLVGGKVRKNYVTALCMWRHYHFTSRQAIQSGLCDITSLVLAAQHTVPPAVSYRKLQIRIILPAARIFKLALNGSRCVTVAPISVFCPAVVVELITRRVTQHWGAFVLTIIALEKKNYYILCVCVCVCVA